jgi:hypothetical protein
MRTPPMLIMMPLLFYNLMLLHHNPVLLAYYNPMLHTTHKSPLPLLKPMRKRRKLSNRIK